MHMKRDRERKRLLNNLDSFLQCRWSYRRTFVELFTACGLLKVRKEWQIHTFTQRIHLVILHSVRYSTKYRCFSFPVCLMCTCARTLSISFYSWRQKLYYSRTTTENVRYLYVNLIWLLSVQCFIDMML